MEWSKIVAAACWVLCAPGPAAGVTGPAQSPCPVRGRVVDVSGAVLLGATVSLPQGSLVTSSDGTFCIASLESGRHSIEISLDGFSPKRVEIDVPRPSVLEVALTPALRADVVVTATRTNR